MENKMGISVSDIEMLNQWYLALLEGHDREAFQIKFKVNETFAREKLDQSTYIYISLLDMKTSFITNDRLFTSYSTAEEDPLPDLEHILSFYYNFFSGIACSKKGDYKTAKDYFDWSEIYLKYIKNDIVKAEYYFQVANFYYKTRQPEKSVSYARLAKNIFMAEPGYNVRTASALNTLGLAAISLKSFDEAEKYFLEALDVLNKENSKTEMTIHTNLGVYYAEKGESRVAILHLHYGLENNINTTFLMAREYFRIDDMEKSEKMIVHGLELCNNESDGEYIHHFNILRDKVTNADLADREKTVRKAIEYFDDHDLWCFVADYTKELSEAFDAVDNQEKALYYGKIAQGAINKYERESALS